MNKIGEIKNKLRVLHMSPEMAPEEIEKRWMETLSGIRFYPLEAEVDKFSIKDIAHALSNICRWGGHTSYHFSVAQHAYIMSHLVSPENAMEALMHDATEAYLGDIPTPIKRLFPEYLDIEDKLAKKLAVKYKYTYPYPTQVYKYDTVMKRVEHDVLLLGKESPSRIKIERLSQEEAERLFLTRYNELKGERNESK
jgi:hypothetical protein